MDFFSSPLIKFLSNKFIKPKAQTPEATISSLATTNPSILPQYIKSYADLLTAKKVYFNRDVSGTPSQWVVDLRASIRPICTVGCIFLLISAKFYNFQIDSSTQMLINFVVSSWFGNRMALWQVRPLTCLLCFLP